MMVLSLQGIQFLVQLLTFMGQKRATGSPACIRTKDPTNRVEVCQTTSSAKLDNSERPLPTLSLITASFPPRYPGTHFCPFASAAS